MTKEFQEVLSPFLEFVNRVGSREWLVSLNYTLAGSAPQSSMEWVSLLANVCLYNRLNGNHQDYAHPDHTRRRAKPGSDASGDTASPNNHCLFPGYD